MSVEVRPVVGEWYQKLEKSQAFTIVDIDEDGETIEIQYFDGALEEISFDIWQQMELVPADIPENWSGPLDVAEPDDFGTEVTDTTEEDWLKPLSEISIADNDDVILETKPDPLEIQLDWEV